MMRDQKLSPSDAGCWIDGHWGVYGITRLIALAESFGFPMDHQANEAVRIWNNSGAEDEGSIPDASDIADEAESWLNENVAEDGYSFGWHDGEFFYQSSDWWAVTKGPNNLLT